MEETLILEEPQAAASNAPLGDGGWDNKVGTSITGSQAVLEALIIEGVDTIFGYPGGAIMPIYDALYDYHDKLKHILVPMPFRKWM